jgi:hypothetical protein
LTLELLLLGFSLFFLLFGLQTPLLFSQPLLFQLFLLLTVLFSLSLSLQLSFTLLNDSLFLLILKLLLLGLFLLAEELSLPGLLAFSVFLELCIVTLSDNLLLSL